KDRLDLLANRAPEQQAHKPRDEREVEEDRQAVDRDRDEGKLRFPRREARVTRDAGFSTGETEFALVAVAIYGLTILLNFAFIAGFVRLLFGRSIREQVKTIL